MPRIVVADDERHIVELITLILEDAADYDIHAAFDGVAAIDLIDRLAPDLALLDYMMPRASGLDVLHHIGANAPDVAAIVVTGKATQDLAIELMKAGAWDYLAKPFAADDLVQIVAATLARRTERLESRRHLHIKAGDALKRAHSLLEDVVVDGRTYRVRTDLGEGNDAAIRSVVTAGAAVVRELVQAVPATVGGQDPEEVLGARLRLLHAQTIESLVTGRLFFPPAVQP